MRLNGNRTQQLKRQKIANQKTFFNRIVFFHFDALNYLSDCLLNVKFTL